MELADLDLENKQTAPLRPVRLSVDVPAFTHALLRERLARAGLTFSDLSRAFIVNWIGKERFPETVLDEMGLEIDEETGHLSVKS